MPRAEIEKDLSFGGFAVLRCPLKPESEPALKMLKESSHQLVMITGDAPLTACYTAAQVHIVDRPVLLLVHRYVQKCLLQLKSSKTQPGFAPGSTKHNVPLSLCQ